MSTKENAKVNPGPVQFRWRSLLGVSVGLFLLFGILLNIVPALLVPLSLHLNGPAGAGALVVSNQADAILIGRSLADVEKHEPRLGAFFVSFMDTICAYIPKRGHEPSPPSQALREQMVKRRGKVTDESEIPIIRPPDEIVVEQSR